MRALPHSFDPGVPNSFVKLAPLIPIITHLAFLAAEDIRGVVLYPQQGRGLYTVLEAALSQP